MADVTFQTDPELIRHWKTYQKISAFEEGDLDVLADYLIRYGFEREESAPAATHFASRVERLRNENFVRQYLDIHAGHMAQEITITGLPERGTDPRFDSILDDATCDEEDYQQAAWRRLYLYMRHGLVATLVSGPSEVSDSKQIAEQTGERSFQVIYEATQIRVRETFKEGPRRGKLKRVIFVEAPYVDSEGSVYEQFLLLEQPEKPGVPYIWQKLRRIEAGVQAVPTSKPVECRVTDEGTGGKVTEIPVVILGRGPKNSFVRALTDSNAAHLNLQSVIDNVNYYGGFQKIAFAGITREEIDKWGEAIAVLLANENAKVLRIDPVYPQSLLEVLASLERKMHRQGKFHYNQLAEDSKQQQSAESKAKDLVVQKVIYDKTLTLLASGEARIWRFIAQMEGLKGADKIEVTIAREFQLEDPEAENLELQTTFDLAGRLGVIEVQKQVLKTLVMKLRLVPDKDKDELATLERLMEEIDKAEKQATPVTSALLAAQNRVAAKFQSAEQTPADPAKPETGK